LRGSLSLIKFEHAPRKNFILDARAMKNYIRVSMQDLQSAGHTVTVCGVIVRFLLLASCLLVPDLTASCIVYLHAAADSATVPSWGSMVVGF